MDKRRNRYICVCWWRAGHAANRVYGKVTLLIYILDIASQYSSQQFVLFFFVFCLPFATQKVRNYYIKFINMMCHFDILILVFVYNRLYRI